MNAISADRLHHPVKKKEVRGQTYMRLSRVLDTRVIWCGDNLEYLKRLPDRCIDLVYIDPPFNTGRDHEVIFGEANEERAFEDRHASINDYIDYMRSRCFELHRVLKDTGTLYYHCDWHADSYVRVMLDQIFGESGFGTHIVWRRATAKGLATRAFPNNHDSIFCYHRGDGFTFNPIYVPHSQERIDKHYSQIESGTGRRYTLGDLLNPNPNRPNLNYEFMGLKRTWRWTKDRMEKAFAEGRIVTTKSGMPRFKRYLDEQPGVPIDSVWTDIPPVNARAKELIGYPTQKPVALMERIIKASSNPGDIVLDAFCGCGTTIEAAESLDRQWIGVDFSPTACKVVAKRLRDKCKIKDDESLWEAGRGFVVKNLPWTEERLRQISPGQFQDWAVLAVEGIPNPKKVGDMGIDGRLYPASSTQPGGIGASGEQLEFTVDLWYPVQVKQTEKVGRPDIDKFEAVLMREKKPKGVFVGFDFTKDAHHEIRKFQQRTGMQIIPMTVAEILKIDEKRRYA